MGSAATTIREVRYMPGVDEQLGSMPRELSTPLRVQLEGFHEQTLQEGTHVELLLVEGRAVRMNFFVDTDGTLWVEQLMVAS